MKKSYKNRKYIVLICFVCISIILVIWSIRGNKALMVSEILISNDRLPSSLCQPDIIVITGDLVDAQHTDIDIALSFSKEATQIAPTYYVTGNHEAGCSEYDTLKAGLKAAGIAVLEDEIAYLEREKIKKFPLSFPGLEIDELRRVVVRNRREIELTYIEFEILKLLASNPWIVFTKEQIYDKVWKEPYSGDYSIVITHIRNIREKSL